MVPAGGLVSGAPIGERRRAGVGLGPEGRLETESGAGAGAGAGACAGAGAEAGRESGAAEGASGAFATRLEATGLEVTGSDVTGLEETGLEETGAPRPDRVRWTGGADAG
ncbi:hypothetical protein FRZ02_06480 [Streptomyces albidoflavus]|uniref:Uncharacterized protein n=1 Tax=Streptomyces albidoflavus TaxID=1886 RepID=A0ABY3H6L3_9ACTN|nr:hypothetical protein FRZ02_06480 [Streptomyces albidoflavus]